MAEFALGLTKTAVEGTLVRVKSAIDEEAEFKEKVQNDLVFITGELEMMRSFLYAANASERAKNPVVRTWVRQLRDLAFDVEDCVDFVVHLDTSKSDWWWRVVPLLSCIAPPLPVNVAVAQIQQLKARVEDVSQRNARYNLIVGDVPMPPPNQLIPVAAESSSAAFDVLREVWEAAGKLRGTGDLKKLITSSEGDDLQVISLWLGGSCCTAGAGAAHQHRHHHEATYIIKKAYDDPEVCQGFERRAWIKLMHPFDADEFLKTLLAQLHPRGKSKALGGTEFGKKMRVSNEQRYLLVLEGVSTVLEWDAISMHLPRSDHGSRVVVSTDHLRTALLCTGEPYAVSQLTRFSDGQFLCAFSKTGSVRRTDIGEFNWQIRCGGVISVVTHRCFMDFSGRGVLPQVYRCIRRKQKGFDGVVFKEHCWVDVPRPFDINDFAVRMFLHFRSRHFVPKEIAEVGKKGDQYVIECCRKFLREGDCLVVIDGLDTNEDWDEIKRTFFSKPTSKCRNSVIVITDHDAVAKHCVLDQQDRMFGARSLGEDGVLDRLIEQDAGISRGVEDSIFYSRGEEEFYWQRFELDGREKELSNIEKHLKKDNPGVISLWGHPGAGKSSLVKKIVYDEDIGMSQFACFSWVNMARPFDPVDFSWRLLLGFQTDEKEKVAALAGLMKGQDPIQACRKFLHSRMFLRRKKFLVVIDGLQSKQDWNNIRKSSFSELLDQSGSCIIVITNKKNVAKYCVDGNEDRLLKVKRLGESGHSPSVKDPSFFVGREKEKRELLVGIPGVISLWGIAGVGKSKLVRNIMDNLFKGSEKMSWVNVPHPFHLMEFSHRLLLGFYSKDLQAQENAAVGIMEGGETIQDCCNFLRQGRCQVVIDGLGSTHDWDLIKAAFLSEPTQTACVIIITTEEIVATHCASDRHRVYNIKGLDADDALHLFTKIAGHRKELSCEKKLIEVTMAKCGGLPKVIVSIAEYLRKEISVSEMDLSTIFGDIHNDFIGKLKKDQRFQDLNGLFSWMQSYFDACPDSLKPCIFYLSIFQSDKRIRRRRLVRRYIAEGYSRDTSGGGTAEENGEDLFAKLVESSIIQLQQTPRSSSEVDDYVWHVNGFFREYIISQPMEDNLVFALEGRCSLNSQRAGQHLVIRSCWDRDKIVFESIDFTRLRSLTVFGEWRSFFIGKDRNMGLLRVLDLEDTDSGLTDDVLEQIGKELPRLKFLSLRRCKTITRLPHSFGGLRQLQTLDIRHTKIAILPHAIVKLVKLQYVRAGTSTHRTLDGGRNARLPSSDEDDCTSTSSEESMPTMGDGAGTVACIATARVDSDSLMRSQTPRLSSASGDETSGRELAIRDDDCTIISPPVTADGDGTGTSHLGTVCGDGASTSSQTSVDNSSQTPEVAENCDDTSRGQHDAAHGDEVLTTRSSWRSKARNALLSYSRCWLSKKKLCACCVEAPSAAIGKLTTLHSFGVVNVSGAHGKAVLEELKNLTQLHKLGVCGINRENWHDLCGSISGHGHLESLSVHLDWDGGASFFSSTEGMLSNLPRTIKSLKLYTKDGQGNVQVPAVLIKQLGNLSNVTKGNLILRISTQAEISSLSSFTNQGMFRHVYVKPAQDGILHYGWWGSGCSGKRFTGAPVLEIDCGSHKLEIYFGDWMQHRVEMLVVHCSSKESSVELFELEHLRKLKEVTLKGSYSEAVKQHLQLKVKELRGRNRDVVLKLD